eukprot:CAMPEP_0198726080 /NCGR_PEP_ID=MMETSP1475-20131203/3250_1 /TAXON_ID= ORGANISM="Unidentified sp., Strain CCMP1999" /NCGR_SAMPLE_ID=MMETSP1475 /ASSEMBLY_ACC=CAM_ASM_001111 /LENGTH=618 /DNA_ID=CAMNT_0044487965 /DNA_START=12 /DNA_END=1865 /DNA_ORIENTATION=+
MTSSTQARRPVTLLVLLCVTANFTLAVPQAARTSGSPYVSLEDHTNILRPRLAVDADRGGFVVCSSAGEHNVLVAFENEQGQARELILHSVTEDRVWERSLKLQLNLGVQESIESCHVNAERQLVFATKAAFDTEDSGCGEGLCWKVLYWRYEVNGGEFSVSSGPTQLNSVEDGRYMGFHLDSSERLLVADHLRGFAVYDLEDPALPRVQNVLYSDAVLNLPSGWDMHPHVGRDLSDRYFAIPMLQFSRRNESQDVPILLLYERVDNAFQFRQLLDLSDFLPDETSLGAYHHYLTVSIDRHVDDLVVVGLVRTPLTKDDMGQDMSRMFTLGREGAKWIPRESDLTPALRGDNRVGFGAALSCDRGRCLICSQETTSEPTCQIYARSDDKSWYVLATPDLVSHTFGATLRGETALVRGEGFIRVYNAPLMEGKLSRTNADSDASCFGAGSVVTVLPGSGGAPTHKPLSAVTVGDRVLSADGHGREEFSEVFLIQHADDDRRRPVLTFELDGEGGFHSSLTVTASHLLAVERRKRGFEYRRADELEVGGTVLSVTADGRIGSGRVCKITRSQDAVRNIHTMSDHVVVDGVIGSCMADVLNTRWHGSAVHLVGRTLLVPLK